MRKRQKEKRRFSLITRILLGTNLVAIGCLFMAQAAPFINPVSWWPPALFGLIYPYLALLNLLFVLYWIWRGRWFFLFSLLSLATGWNLLNTHIQFNKHQDLPAQDLLKVMSYNVRIFDYYNWSESPDANAHQHMLETIAAESPQVVCFQEYFQDTHKFRMKSKMQSIQAGKYAHINIFKKEKNGKQFGIATYSAYPIADKGKVTFNNSHSQYAIYTDIRYRNQIIRVYNVHFESIRLSREDYLFVSEITDVDNQRLKDNSLKIIGKIRVAAQKRAIQVETLLKHIQSSPYPVLLCGDFNDTPTSWTYKQLCGPLIDAFQETGFGIGQTYHGILPGFRIDYILHDSSFTSYNFHNLKAPWSDHYPVVSYFEVQP